MFLVCVCVCARVCVFVGFKGQGDKLMNDSLRPQRMIERKSVIENMERVMNGKERILKGKKKLKTIKNGK